MPARSDLHWSQLKVGVTIFVAAIALVVAIFAMTGQSGWFTPKLNLVTYVDDAGGMRPGASVNLEGVIIGTVTDVGLSPKPPDSKRPVEVKMRVTADHQRWLRTDSMVELGTEGPLGETLVNIASGSLTAPPPPTARSCPPSPRPASTTCWSVPTAWWKTPTCWKSAWANCSIKCRTVKARWASSSTPPSCTTVLMHPP